ncbi:hypothetical protein MMC26_004233 [Xylographa opegraphella]|nr:hypothetical protein [Xylographa opegraphella]
MDRAQWLVRETLHRVRISALHRLFHEGHHTEASKVNGIILRQYQQTRNSLDDLERGIRELGPETPQPTTVRDAGAQNSKALIQLDEVPSVLNSTKQTEEPFTDSYNSPPSIQAVLNGDTPAALCSREKKQPGKSAAAIDKSTNIPVLLLQPGLMYMMEHIRSSTQVVYCLEEKRRNAVQAIQTTYEDKAVSSEALKTTLNDEEQISDTVHEKEMTEDAKNDAWREVLLMDQTISNERKNLDLTRMAFLSTIERALSEAQLLKQIPDKDEAWKAREQLYNRSMPALPTNKTASVSVVSADNLFRRAALANLSEVHNLYMDHLDQFENRGGMYENDFREYRQAFNEGACSLTMTDFDRTYVRNITNLTRGLQKAEVAYDTALQQARRLGLLENDTGKNRILFRMSRMVTERASRPVSVPG